MNKILMNREGTVYSAAEYISQIKNIDEHIKTLCDMIQLIYTTIPEGKKVDIILSYDLLKALQEICRTVGIDFDFNGDYIRQVDVGESKHHKWVANMITRETFEICKRYNLVMPTADMIDYGAHADLSAVGMLHLWMCNKEGNMYINE